MTGCRCHNLWIHGAGKDLMSEVFADVVEGEALGTAFRSALRIVVEKVAQVFFHFVAVATHNNALVTESHTTTLLFRMSRTQFPLKLIGGVLSEDNWVDLSETPR